MEEGNSADLTETHTATAAFHTNAKIRTKLVVNRQMNVKSCVFCNESHAPVNCTKIIEHKARIYIVKRDRLCFNCLGHHNVAHCKSHQSCRKCKKRHHTSLCKDEGTQHNAKETGTVLHSQAQINVLLKTSVAQVSSGIHCTNANILFDEGVQRSFIIEKLATALNLAITGQETVNLSGFGDTNESKKVRHLNTGTIYLLTDTGKLPINVFIVPEIAVPMKIYVHKRTHLKYLYGLKLAHPVSHDPMFEVSLLIGVDYYWSIVADRIVRGTGPTAVKSKIGYLLSGLIKGLPENPDHTHTSTINILVGHKVAELNLEKFWEVEAAGIESTDNKSENGQFQDANCISYHRNRYVGKLTWKEEHPTLLNNRSIAQRRTESAIKRLNIFV
ncbi:unnamed protein product [Mytilus coruscus]|uniref:DUF1758 domain-containing protein n=1 Tax=Mytilus coruscus TaxID=42192 RepID=A0A6J8E681_MYTCO|nr:unnamed protein product [Mytilus coruscus]